MRNLYRDYIEAWLYNTFDILPKMLLASVVVVLFFYAVMLVLICIILSL